MYLECLTYAEHEPWNVIWELQDLNSQQWDRVCVCNTISSKPLTSACMLSSFSLLLLSSQVGDNLVNKCHSAHSTSCDWISVVKTAKISCVLHTAVRSWEERWATEQIFDKDHQTPIFISKVDLPVEFIFLLPGSDFISQRSLLSSDNMGNLWTATFIQCSADDYHFKYWAGNIFAFFKKFVPKGSWM